MADRLETIVAEVLELPVDEIGADTGPATTGQWVSLRHLRIVAAVEDAYGVSFAPREIRAIRSVADLREALRRKDVTT
jgi:acyl carrier protein